MCGKETRYAIIFIKYLFEMDILSRFPGFYNPFPNIYRIVKHFRTEYYFIVSLDSSIGVI